ncbi:MAG: 50S ribosomal protein L21 [Deltaproteobacteria bacterium]|nr:50S ribosomal protein L21 [Deltaproteobacteria bacterium]
MYAVLKTGGKQYKALLGDTLKVEKLKGEVGEPIVFEKVLMIAGDDENVTIGQPFIKSASVRGHIVKQAKDKKIIVFKYKRRKKYRLKKGHRQLFTQVKINSIDV